MPQTEISTRHVALTILQNVLRQKQALDECLEQNPALNLLEKRDRAFVHLLVATTLRRLGQIDAVIRECLDKPDELKIKPQDLLRLGTAQLLLLGTPAHAAVDTIVELAGSEQATAPYKGLINAILRRVAREGKDIMLPKQDAVKLNMPAWLWLSWRQTYGVGQARQMAEACLGEALTDISVKENPAAWAEKLKARLLPTGSLRLDGSTPLTELEGFASGQWWVQDAAAALPAQLLGDVAGKTVLDLCAAPGGKTAQLAARGAKVVAVDRAEKRLHRLRENLQRLNLAADVEVVCTDAAKYQPAEKFSHILLDAPCSATGTIRRHPDILRLKQPEDVLRLASLQQQLLNHATTQLLAVGGTLIYTVCSLQPEEGELQIAKLLENNPHLHLSPITAAEIGGCSAFITPNGFLRCLPYQWAEWGGIDGFFAARLTLKS